MTSCHCYLPIAISLAHYRLVLAWKMYSEKETVEKLVVLASFHFHFHDCVSMDCLSFQCAKFKAAAKRNMRGREGGEEDIEYVCVCVLKI